MTPYLKEALMGSNPSLDHTLAQLRLGAMRQHYDRLAEEASAVNLSYDRYLQALVDHEVSQREIQRQRRCVQHAHFPVLKELADFDWSAIPKLNKARILSLARGTYVAQTETVLLVGNPGLGKTHIATSLGLMACRQGHRVRFFTAAGLVNDLIQAQDAHRLPQVLASLLKYRLLIIDELGFLPLSTTGAQLLFQLCSTIHERVALILTTNLRFAEWTQLFGSESLTAALLDRLTARAHIVEFVGESYRLRQRRQRDRDAICADIWGDELGTPRPAGDTPPRAATPIVDTPQPTDEFGGLRPPSPPAN
jgi:DNA replication protein DnaC